jgi:hypothetical protein
MISLLRKVVIDRFNFCREDDLGHASLLSGVGNARLVADAVLVQVPRCCYRVVSEVGALEAG